MMFTPTITDRKAKVVRGRYEGSKRGGYKRRKLYISPFAIKNLGGEKKKR